jgi:hypothetical protein
LKKIKKEKEEGIYCKGKIFEKGESRGPLKGKRKKIKGGRCKKMERTDSRGAGMGGKEMRGKR